MEVILDTNFIVACVRDRIDFIDQLKELGFKITVPREVSQELKDIRDGGRVRRDGKAVIETALEIVNSKDVKNIRIGGKSVDAGLIAKGKEGVYIGTLDKEIKRNVPNRVVVLKAKKRVSVERD